MIDAYYKFEKLNPEKAKTRFDLVCYSTEYSPLHQTNKNEECWIYFGKNPNIKANGKRKSDIAISNRVGHLTSVFIPEVEKPDLGFGDFGEDTFLILLNGCSIEILVFRRQKSIQNTLYNLLFDGEFDSEIEVFRNKAKEYRT